MALVTSCMLWISSLSAFASKDDGFWGDKVPESLSDRFSEAFVDLKQEWVTEFIDSLKTEGTKSGGEGYACLADILIAVQACERGDSLEFVSISSQALEETKELKAENLYFNLLANRVGFYVQCEDYYKAQKEADVLISEARQYGNIAGMMSGYMSMGVILSGCCQHKEAIRNFEHALKCVEKTEHENLMVKAQVLFCIGDSYMNAKQYTKARDYLIKSINTSPTEYGAYISLALCYFKLNDISNFKKYLSELHEVFDESAVGDNPNYLHVTAIDKGLNHDYSKALAVCESIEDPVYKMRSKADVYRLMNDWQNTYKCYEMERNYSDSIRQAIYSNMLCSADSEMAALYNLHEKDAEIRKNRTMILCISFGAALLLIVSFAVILNIRMRSRWQKNKLAIIQRYNSELTEAKKNAEEANRLKTLFLQNISHDVRTPLNAIVGFSQLLGLPDGFNSDEEKEQYKSYVTNNSEMLIMLFEDILNMDEIEKGNFKLVYSETLCNELCVKTLKCVEYRVQPTVNLKFSSNVDDSFKANLDGRRIQQVIVNFLTNACKHTHQGEIRLDLNYDESKRSLRFSVIDTGEGVAPEIREKLFSRFVKKGKEDSHGIGLDICNTIAEKMGGSVSLDQTYTEGAKFDLVLTV